MEGIQVGVGNGRVNVVRAGCDVSIKIVVRSVLELRPRQADELLP
jgi:hypothetical protein